MYTYYRVYLTPRNGRLTYGTEIEISDYVRFDGIPSIKRSVDATDYEMGVFKYDDLEIKAINLNGYFNDELDSRSIFKFGRDRAKIRVVFSNTDDDTIVFRGLINEEATRLEPETSEINFRALSRDSVIRNTKVSAGTIVDGSSAQSALAAVLNVPAITAVLNYSLANNNPAYNFVIDDGSTFDNKNTRDVLNSLLLASNSVMLLDTDDNMIIKDRSHDLTRDPLNLYGAFDLHQRTNVLKIKTFNSGRQRMFTAFKVNNTEESNNGQITDYGYRQKKITLDFITDAATESAIASALLDEFKIAKIELELDVETKTARNLQLLDRVSLDYPLRVKPVAGKFLPVIGSAKTNDANTPLPETYGSLSIDPSVAFKVLQIVENPKDFTTTLKLRQIGTEQDDGYFTTPTSCILGFAKIGSGTICAGGTACDKFVIATIGAAQIGCTEVA